jgi:hypothetical protein
VGPTPGILARKRWNLLSLGSSDTVSVAVERAITKALVVLATDRDCAAVYRGPVASDCGGRGVRTHRGRRWQKVAMALRGLSHQPSGAPRQPRRPVSGAARELQSADR